MRRLALCSIPLLVFSTPAVTADLDGPVYRERDVVAPDGLFLVPT